MHPSPRLFDHAFERRAEANPDAPALRVAGATVTYAEVRADATRIARSLVSQGVGKGSLVGLNLARGRRSVAAMLGVLRTGAAVLPLPPSYPDARLRSIVAGARPELILHEGDSVPPGDAGVEAIDVRDTSGTEGPLPARATGQEAEDRPAFVLSSSGTTGRPKLIVRSHRSFFHRLEWTWRTLPFASGEVGCQKAHQTTTHAVYELFEPLLQGVPTLILSDEVARDLERFWAEVDQGGVTRLLLVPSMLRATLDGGIAPPRRLRAVILMGEAVSATLARRAGGAFDEDTALFSIYGSTEASSVLVSGLRTAPLDGVGLPLGDPLGPEITAHVLGPGDGPTPPGEVGRLHIGGSALFDGYHGDAELTSQVLRFVDGRRLFDTRDDVRIGEDGRLDYLGRADDTVKVRGFRVDLLEVERHLRGLEGVRDAVAVVPPDGGATPVLHAYVVPADVDTTAALERLRAVLPAHAVPSLLRAVDAFPRTPNGKVDRRALAEPPGPAQGAWQGVGRSETEARVARIWTRILGHGDFGPATSFFEAGGTSLSAFSMLVAVRDAFDLSPDDLDAGQVQADPTVAGVARRIDGGADAGAASAPPPGLVVLRTGGEAGPPPLFLVSSAGGSLGAYARFARALDSPRPVVGLEDPYLSGRRSLGASFGQWVGHFVDMIRHRQDAGPYHICAYSSAGAFGWEIVRRLEGAGAEVAALVLIDPMSLDSRRRTRWGWWAARCSYAHPVVRWGARIAGRLRSPLSRAAARVVGEGAARDDLMPRGREAEAMGEEALQNASLLRRLACLMELDTGVPLPSVEAPDAAPDPPPPFARFRTAVTTAHPQADPDRLERMVRQYGVQVQCQRGYALRPVAAPVFIFEPESGYAGLLEGLVRPFAGSLQAFRVPVGTPSPRQQELLEGFQGWRPHYWCMRDETFAAGVAAEVDRLLA